MGRNNLLKSISLKIGDYRKGEVQKLTPEHIDRWVKQFDAKDQEIILSEIDHIFSEFYVSREKTKECLRQLICDEEVLGKNKRDRLLNSTFLKIQENGNSQQDLLSIIDEILTEEYGISINECKGNGIYFYIDDCVFTGNRFRYDLVPWIEKTTFGKGTKIITYHLAIHLSGFYYAKTSIVSAAQKKQVEVLSYGDIQLNNDRKIGQDIATLWPVEFTGDK